MSYVVGFLGKDFCLGQTFICENTDEILVGLNLIRKSNKDVFPFANSENSEENDFWTRTWFTSENVLETDLGYYFIGGLQKVVLGQRKERA